MTKTSGLVLESSLQVFFYDHLQEFNKKSLSPLPNETIFYSSLVMDNFGDSSKFFEQVDGKAREKILGIKLLEASQLPREKQRAAIKDVAETSLLVCGYFADSLNKKLIDVKYYQDLGKIAYSQLNSITPEAYDVPSFYKKMAHSFNGITLLMNLVSKKYSSDRDMPWLILTDRKVS
ncbi:MAG: hypothetical protein KBD76_11795 [Bacteriovorax sp.]|jgi:hypothetical protein|nr:hypothetical protein [Bacteriovorax sp.]